MENLLLRTDVYKLGHMRQYAPGTTKVYSYLCARSDKKFHKTVFFGLQYYLEKYLTQKITHDNVDEFIMYHKAILGDIPEDTVVKLRNLADLGYLPVEIKAVREGDIIPVKNVLMTLTNTVPGYGWCVGFVESLLLKLWYPITVATTCMYYRSVVEIFFRNTVDDNVDFLKNFMVHDFGYRGDATEEGAGLSGAAHLLSFNGSDTIPALYFTNKYYQSGLDNIMASVPASEHSVMCSYGRDGELDAYKNMLSLYPNGIVSIVSDTYDIWNVITNFAVQLKDQIMSRNGKCVLRPDSGNPENIICGDPNAPEGSPAYKGCIRLLDEIFGHTINSKGFKVLDSHIGLIYGDGMYLERYVRTLTRLMDMGYSAENLVIGVGGILRNHTRDTLGFAIKATYVEVDGEQRDIEKNPVTDPGKKSHKGLLALYKDADGNITTHDQVSLEEEAGGYLQVVYRNGVVVRKQTFQDISSQVRANIAAMV